MQQDSEDDGLLCVRSRGSWKQFELDRVFGPSSSQEQVHCIIIHCTCVCEMRM